jgi:hypothetical protein
MLPNAALPWRTRPSANGCTFFRTVYKPGRTVKLFLTRKPGVNAVENSAGNPGPSLGILLELLKIVATVVLPCAECQMRTGDFLYKSRSVPECFWKAITRGARDGQTVTRNLLLETSLDRWKSGPRVSFWNVSKGLETIALARLHILRYRLGSRFVW